MAVTAGRLARHGIIKRERAHATGKVAWGLWSAGTQRLCASDFFRLAPHEANAVSTPTARSVVILKKRSTRNRRIWWVDRQGFCEHHRIYLAATVTLCPPARPCNTRSRTSLSGAKANSVRRISHCCCCTSSHSTSAAMRGCSTTPQRYAMSCIACWNALARSAASTGRICPSGA